MVWIPISVWRPETISYWGQEVDIPAQQSGREDEEGESNGFLQSSMGWMVPTYIGEGHLLYLVHKVKC